MKTRSFSIAFPVFTSVALLLVLGFAFYTSPHIATAVEANINQESVPAAQLSDLDVTFIERQPMYSAYCVDYLWDEAPGMPGRPFICPGTENERRWPDPGEIVTFTAHITNKGEAASPPFEYAWLIDGTEVLSGSLPALAPAATITTTYTWSWAHSLDGERLTGAHTVGFSADPHGLVVESFKSNNSLVDRTDAVSFQIVITPEMIQAYNQPVTDTLPRSAEDWFQKQVKAMNAAFNAAVYPATPSGAVVQVRINRFLVRDAPIEGDRSHDGGWFVDADFRTYSAYYDPATDIDWAWIHEMSHQMSLIDLYQFEAQFPFTHVLNREGLRMNIGFNWPAYNSIMFGGDTIPYTTPWVYDSHTAGGAKSNLGHRNGFYGAYQFDIPQENWLKLLDNGGQAAQGIKVDLYRKLNLPGVPADVDNTPEISGQTVVDGSLHLTNLPVNGGVTLPNGHTLRDNPFGMVDIIGYANMYLVKLIQGDHEEFHWLDITPFNLAYWQGQTQAYTHTLQTHLPMAGAPPAPQDLASNVEGSMTTLYWSPVPGLIKGYNVYRMAYPDFIYEKISMEQASIFYVDSFWRNYYSDFRYYVVTAVDDQGRESGFSRHWWVPRLFSPVSVVVEPDGNTLVQDRSSFFNFLELSPTGRWLRVQPVTEFSANNTQFFTLNPQGWLVVSFYGDTDNPTSIRLYNPQTEAGFQVGSYGAGKVEKPAGVAWWGDQVYSIEGPYQIDSQTQLLAHFDGSFTGAQGEPGSSSGVSFTGGQYGLAAVFDNSDVLTFPSNGNLNRTQGTVEFWVRPSWNGNDNQNHTFFEIGETWENRIKITKDGANNLRLMTWDALGQEYGVVCWVSNWKAGEWRHVAAGWNDEWLMLAVDGVPCKIETNGGVPGSLGDTIYVGNSPSGDQSALAAIDELRINNTPRFGNTDQIRILAVDNANHRVLALDGLGNLVTYFGSYGSGNEQFIEPLGLVVDSVGNVIVTDRNNNRLQVLAFDGHQFSLLRTLTGDFLHPEQAAVYHGWVVVADTGNNLVKVLDPLGNLAATYERPDTGMMIDMEFRSPEGVAVDLQGQIVVADTQNSRVVRIAENVLPKYFIYLPLSAK